MRDCLIIIPISKPQYFFGFSAPMAWMFTGYKVIGVYSFLLTENDIKNHDNFIIELNWITELYEVIELSKIIRRLNPKAKILAGGLFTGIHYETLIKLGIIDYTIKGFWEEPIKEFLDDVPIKKIQNIVTVDFENSITYVFRSSDWSKIDFSLDWNPMYLYLEEEESTIEKFKDINNFRLPMIITSRAGCDCIHEGCEYCLGSKNQSSYYNSHKIIISNDDLIALINKAEIFKKISIYILSDVNQYDFKGQHFNTDATIEIDSSIKNVDTIANIANAFNKSFIGVPVYKSGIMAHDAHSIETLNKLNRLNSPNHIYKFVSYSDLDPHYKEVLGNSLLYGNLDSAFCPEYAIYDNYKNFEKALTFSKRLWDGTHNGKKTYPDSLTGYLKTFQTDKR